MENIPFAPPRIDDDIIAEVTEALRSGWITTGPRVKTLEKEISAYCGNPATLCVNSNSGGMELILRWFGVKEGDEVIVPAYTYCATANVVAHTGAVPVMVDVDENRLMDIKAVEDAITERTKVIIPVDLGGLPCDYDALFELVNAKKALFNPRNEIQRRLSRILLLTDAAHSIGAVYKGKRAGSISDVSVFSFHAVKNITTAEGGAVCLNLPVPFDNEGLYKELNTLTLHGQSKDAFSKNTAGNWRYDVTLPGYKLNMTDIQAAMGLVELRRYQEDTLPKRKWICNEYIRLLSRYEWAKYPLFSGTEKESSYHLFLLNVDGITEDQRNRMIGYMAEKGIAVNVHYIPLPMLTYYKTQGYRMEDYPVSFHLYQTTISLPVFYELTAEQITRVVAVINEAYCVVSEKDKK